MVGGDLSSLPADLPEAHKCNERRLALGWAVDVMSLAKETGLPGRVEP